MAVAVVIPAVGNLSRADLRKDASMLAGTMRATYDAAALSGEHHRLVFELGQRVIHVEASPGTLRFGADSNALQESNEQQQESKKEGLSFAPWLGDDGIVSPDVLDSLK